MCCCYILLVVKYFAMNCMNSNQMDFCVISPSSLTQDHMVSMILMASQVRPSLVFG
jgi:hypothetical protein